MSNRSRFGRWQTKLSTTKGSRVFFVHEDLLCASSQFFHDKFQGKRRNVDGFCYICWHKLYEVGLGEVTYCRSCGENLHSRCIQDRRKHEADEVDEICPLCDQKWSDRCLTQAHCFTLVDEVAIEIYEYWLYRMVVPYSAEDWYHVYENLVKAYVLGLEVQDSKFCGDL